MVQKTNHKIKSPESSVKNVPCYLLNEILLYNEYQKLSLFEKNPDTGLEHKDTISVLKIREIIKLFLFQD